MNPSHTSQACPACGTIDKANRISQELFRCNSCGHTMNADHNAAINILRRSRPDAVVPMAPAPLTTGTHQLVIVDATSAASKPRPRPTRKTKAATTEQQLLLL